MTAAPARASTIHGVFERVRREDRIALIPYLMAGYPTPDRALELIGAASREADLIEIGVPFSDPVADGRSIQHAAQVSLHNGFRLRPFLDALAASPPACPALLMSYVNPMLAYGRDRLLADLAALRIAGLIVPDLPLEETDDWRAAAVAHGLFLVHLVAPTSPDERIQAAADATDAFLYAVSLAGTTGARPELDPGLPVFLRRIRRLTDKPLAVGFGLSSPDHVRALRGLADGVIVGSRIIEAVRAGESALDLIRVLRDATGN